MVRRAKVARKASFSGFQDSTWTGSGGLAGVGYADTDGDKVRDDAKLSVTTVDSISPMYP